MQTGVFCWAGASWAQSKTRSSGKITAQGGEWRARETEMAKAREVRRPKVPVLGKIRMTILWGMRVGKYPAPPVLSLLFACDRDTKGRGFEEGRALRDSPPAPRPRALFCACVLPFLCTHLVGRNPCNDPSWPGLPVVRCQVVVRVGSSLDCG